MEYEKINFELSSKQIKYKEILNKQFLELEIWAISDINPNRNKTHFTLEAMKQALPDMKNKPILGFFNKDDFETHNGQVGYDIELDNDYWNTENGERILGLIRESDPIEIVEKDGLHWVKVRCALWVQYCYKQVKRLLRDRNKKVSVEIVVHKSYMREDGIKDILEFSLGGITILGSKNGKQIMEGIPGAHLSVIEELDNIKFENQKKVLCYAYQQKDNSEQIDNFFDDKNTEKEVKAQVEENIVNSVENENFEAENVVNEPEKEICGCEEQCDCTEQIEETLEDAKTEKEGINDIDAKGEELISEQAEQLNSDCCEGCDENMANCNLAADEEQAGADSEDPVIKCDSDCDQEQFISMSEYEAKCAEYEAKICELQACIDDLNSKQEQFSNYEEIKGRMEQAEAKLFGYYCDQLVEQAKDIMCGITVSEESYASIIEKCEKGEYECNEDLEKDIAYAAFKSRPAKEVKFSAPLQPQAEIITQINKKPMTREERIAERNKNGK